MRRIFLSGILVICTFMCSSQINVACTNFTSEGKKWQPGIGLRKIFESAISKSKLRFKLIERSDDISIYFEKLQEEKNLYTDLYQDFSKKPELAGVDYLVVGNVISNISTGKFSLNINFLKLTGNDATMKLPLFIILTKDQLLDDAQSEALFVAELNSFADNYALAVKNPTDLTKLPDIYKQLEKNDSTIGSLSNAVTALEESNNAKDKKIGQLGTEIENIKEYTNIAPLNVWGVTMDPGGDLVQTSAISLVMQNVWDYNKDSKGFKLRMTDSALYYANIATNRFPNFPFGFFAVAAIKLSRNANDKEGLAAAKKAKHILEITTTIYGHNGQHDELLAQIQKALPNL